MYTELFDGLRGYYASYPTRRKAAGFHAAMSLSFLACCNLSSITTLADFALHRNIDWTLELAGKKALLLAVGVVVALAHVWFGKSTGLYASKAPAKSARWKRQITLYACVSAILFLSMLGVVLFT